MERHRYGPPIERRTLGGQLIATDYHVRQNDWPTHRIEVFHNGMGWWATAYPPPRRSNPAISSRAYYPTADEAVDAVYRHLADNPRKVN